MGLSQLQDLRAKGSTLGKVTEAEHKLLQDSLVSLSQSVSPPEYRARMQQVIEYAKNLQAAVDRQYEAQYGAGAYRDTRLAPQSQPGLPLSSGRNAPPASAPRTVRFEDL
jgi:hypothetical protein